MTDFASASKMTYKQFLLLRVLWVSSRPTKTNVKTALPARICSRFQKMEKALEKSDLWARYIKSIPYDYIPDCTFSIPRYCQILANKDNRGSTRPDSFDTPVAKRTRSHHEPAVGISRIFQDMQLATPSKPTRVLFQTPIMKTPRDIDSGLPGSTQSQQSDPFTPAAEVSADVQNTMYVQTRDEQIVNTALVTFLNARTMHCTLGSGCKWTMHRKALVAEFEHAQFESQLDGHLDDGHENPWALIEVKPVIRGITYRSSIQIQESAQMVSWIKSSPTPDLDEPYDTWFTIPPSSLLAFSICCSGTFSVLNKTGILIYLKTATRYLSLWLVTVVAIGIISQTRPKQPTTPRSS